MGFAYHSGLMIHTLNRCVGLNLPFLFRSSKLSIYRISIHLRMQSFYKLNFHPTNVGLCLADIGAMMTQEFCSDEETSSILETLCAKAKESVFNTLEADDDKTEVGIEDLEIFQFDDNETKGIYNEVADFPKLLQGHDLNLAKSQNSLRFSSVRSMSGFYGALLSPLYEEIDNGDTNYDTKNIVAKNGDDNDKNSSCTNDDNKARGLVKSMSFSVQNYNHESSGIFFGNMSEDEWEMFLKSFEKLLPRVFEGVKCMCAKQRLGTSCKF
ncbi:hypothetical protein SCA6_002081 [Theobroma cacao]